MSLGKSFEYNAICDVCRFVYKNYELRKRWDGLMVCEKDWEPRHELDFYKPRNDTHKLPFTSPDDDNLGRVSAVLASDISSPTLEAWTLLPLDTELADTSSEFTVGTSTFRPSVAGDYMITAACKFTLSGIGSQYGVAIYKNGVAQVVYGPYTVATPCTAYAQGARYLTLTTSDDITLRYYVSGSASTIVAADEATYMHIRAL